MQEHQSTQRVTLRDGRTALVRLLRPDDAAALTRLFEGLSAITRGYYGPHPFDRATAERLCAESGDVSRTARYVAVLDEGQLEAQIIGYMILTREIHPDDQQRHGGALDLAHCASFAPCLADEFQSQGIGTQMAQWVLAQGHAMGLSEVILMGGVQARNVRAHRMYCRLGFRKVGEFWTHGALDLLNYSMVLSFQRQGPEG
ncbi:MAG: GNAT family N-acetyltransferase [Chloroflexi bacterium]|nr:GNAT family N-acetyltransferase [Chloroflexota bacterium]